MNHNEFHKHNVSTFSQFISCQNQFCFIKELWSNNLTKEKEPSFKFAMWKARGKWLNFCLMITFRVSEEFVGLESAPQCCLHPEFHELPLNTKISAGPLYIAIFVLQRTAPLLSRSSWHPGWGGDNSFQDMSHPLAPYKCESVCPLHPIHPITHFHHRSTELIIQV